ncbi:MAG: hypothetical protein E7641_00245 [Ruminococcaceae bacterium]|nr:hypothetical protein [Oscillospiraceae bacterium]
MKDKQEIISSLLCTVSLTENAIRHYLQGFDILSAYSFGMSAEEFKKRKYDYRDLTSMILKAIDSSGEDISSLSVLIRLADNDMNVEETVHLSRLMDSLMNWRSTLFSAMEVCDKAFKEKELLKLSTLQSEARRALAATEFMKGRLENETLHNRT